MSVGQVKTWSTWLQDDSISSSNCPKDSGPEHQIGFSHQELLQMVIDIQADKHEMPLILVYLLLEIAADRSQSLARACFDRIDPQCAATATELWHPYWRGNNDQLEYSDRNRKDVYGTWKQNKNSKLYKVINESKCPSDKKGTIQIFFPDA